MEVRVKRWGNSLALRIPKPLAIEVGLEDDSRVELSLVDGKLVITPWLGSELELDDLLCRISEENLHREVETGPAVGSEAW